VKQVTTNHGGDFVKNNKYIVLIGLCIFTLAVGILGVANVGFFNSNTGLEIIEILLGIGGLLIALRTSN
jgi:uncharacterized membrane protein